MKESTKGGEEPSMTVDLLRVLLLETEYDLHGRSQLEGYRRVESHGGGVCISESAKRSGTRRALRGLTFEEVGRYIFA